MSDKMFFDDIPDEVMITEVLPRMPINTLLSLRYTSSKFRELATIISREKVYAGELRKTDMGPETLYKLGKSSPDLQTGIIADFLYRLHEKVDLLNYFLQDPKRVQNRFIWSYLASNPNVSLQDMEKYPQLFESELFNQNPNVTPEYVASHPNIPWKSWILTDYNDNFPLDYILQMIRSNVSHRFEKSLYHNDRLTYADILENPDIDWNLGASLINSNFTEDDIQKVMKKYSSDRLQYWRHLYSGNPNLDFTFVEDSGETKASIDKLEREMDEKSYNSDEEDARYIWNWELLSKHPNATLPYIKAHPELAWEPDFILENPNFTIPEAVKAGLVYEGYLDSSSRNVNPNTTLDYIRSHPEVDWHYQGIAQNKFNKDPDYRRVIYRYIYRLLPDQVTIKLDGKIITENKEFLYGMLAAIYALKLKYDIKYIADDHEIPLQLEDYKMFTSGDAHQPLLMKIEDLPFHFTTLQFLSGVKEVYESNNIPFAISHYYEKNNNYIRVQIS